MSEEITTDTLIAGENVQSVTTETGAETKTVDANSDDKASKQQPNVEVRDGKMYVDGVRVYTRDDTNKIAANATREYESKLLSDLEVDSFDQVKNVVKTLQSAGDTEGGLNVESLKNTVRKREQTVEELKAELNRVKTEMHLDKHIGKLQSTMPSGWSQDQKSAVIDLMKARNMLHLEGDSFYIRSGDEFITQDGETPDYKGAVQMVGKALGLPIAKPGVESFDADRKPSKTEAAKQGFDEALAKTDPAYRNAYVKLRSKGHHRDSITDAMIRQQIDRSQLASTDQRMTTGGKFNNSKPNSRRR